MAKKISKEELDGELFFKLNNTIIDREKERRKLMIENIQEITEIFDKKLYLVQFENYAGFLGQLELYYSRSMVYKFMLIKKKLVDEFGMDPYDIFDIDTSRLEDIAKFAQDKIQANDLLGKARLFTSREWKDEFNILRGKPVLDNCPHKMIAFEICATCGLKQHPHESHQ